MWRILLPLALWVPLTSAAGTTLNKVMLIHRHGSRLLLKKHHTSFQEPEVCNLIPTLIEKLSIVD
jgi:hypothetical protein